MVTEKQQAVLDFVQAHHAKHAHHPTIREIQAHFGFASPFAVTRHLQALEQKGLLERIAGKARGFIDPAQKRRHALLSKVTQVPLYGVIPAGLPAANEQEPDGFVTFDTATFGLTRNAKLFALRVRGDSMIGANIVDGDTVFLTPREPHPRDIVAALIDGESTLKRFLVQRGQPFLRAENPRYPDLLPATELLIQGVMVGLLRTAQN
ncbi:transcriptional repressor LexA [Oleiharenicola lentus]|uniref:transcriptional repressor LexA n=1 Tax=Oleiharenicola lentus TaxID=2508720 RepID=UPI003F6762E6